MAVPWKAWLEFHTKVLCVIFCSQDMIFQWIVPGIWISWSQYPDCTAFVWVKGHPPLLFPGCQVVQVILQNVTVLLGFNLPIQDVSSAKTLVLDWTQSGRLLINNRNNEGPRIVPCGTPLMTGMPSEAFNKLLQGAISQEGLYPFIWSSFFIRHWCSTRSNALEKSNTMRSCWCFLSSSARSSVAKVRSCVSQLLLALKPCWQSVRI